MVIRELGLSGMDWIELDYDMCKERAVVKTVIKLGVL
jgi:hypothetical protein